MRVANLSDSSVDIAAMLLQQLLQLQLLEAIQQQYGAVISDNIFMMNEKCQHAVCTATSDHEHGILEMNMYRTLLTFQTCIIADHPRMSICTRMTLVPD